MTTLKTHVQIPLGCALCKEWTDGPFERGQSSILKQVSAAEDASADVQGSLTSRGSEVLLDNRSCSPSPKCELHVANDNRRFRESNLCIQVTSGPGVCSYVCGYD